MFGELSTGGATPVLEAMMQFAAGRQRVLAHNVANISTPNFLALDVSVRGFQAQLRDAVERRREAGGKGALDMKSTGEVEVAGGGRGLRLTPGTPSGGVLFHDRNNRSLEKSMQDLVENATAFRVATDLLRSRYQLMQAAISERA
jgi:flagellar basal-body rod protein FlgB